METASLSVAPRRASASQSAARRILIVDLNNFATFPTLAVGLITASLRNGGFKVQLISPLEHDVPAVEREHPERLLDHVQRRIHLSTFAPLAASRDCLRDIRHWHRNRPHPRFLREVSKALETGPDAVLLSAYLQHYATVVEVGKLALAARVPLVLGGPAFSEASTNEAWRTIAGLSLLVGAEVDISLPSIIHALLNGEDLMQFAGVTLPDGRRTSRPKPLRPLDAAPVPDFSDFPWDRYRVRIIPLMASRGCQWGRCTFCSDVVSVSGRIFRSRSLDSVMDEMRQQAERYSTENFLFLDLKLNSDPKLLRGIVENVQRVVPGAQWIGTVHVDQRRDNGLTSGELKAAAAAGMRRVSFGLESGSQRLLDTMMKGSSVEGNGLFIRNAYEAGISVRCTMFKGYPGETSDDLELTARFLEEHGRYIDRIRFNEFSVLTGTPIYRTLREEPGSLPSLRSLGADDRNARLNYRRLDDGSRAYRRAKRRVLQLVHQVNRRQVRSSARAFDGLM